MVPLFQVSRPIWRAYPLSDAVASPWPCVPRRSLWTKLDATGRRNFGLLPRKAAARLSTRLRPYWRASKGIVVSPRVGGAWMSPDRKGAAAAILKAKAGEREFVSVDTIPWRYYCAVWGQPWR
jgi:hypothetical protein